jgi:hypothetical protein
LIVPALIMTLVACTSSTGGTDPSTSSNSPTPTGTAPTSSTPVTSTPPSSPAPTASQTKAALAAYSAFTNAVNQAQRKPGRVSKALALHAIDPALGTARGVLTQFQVSNIEWHGTPPASRTRVLSAKPAATPYPTVTIVDCPTVSTTWRPFNSKTGKPVKTVKPKVAPPWATTATVALYKGKWMVQTEKTDMTRTCAP